MGTLDHGEATGRPSNPLDVDSDNFDAEAYLSNMLKQQPLDELVDQEVNLFNEVRQLESEMEHLVYENYNKFITATDTIRKMKTDFGDIEAEMDKLAENIQKISAMSDELSSSSLSKKRANVNQLAQANKTLKHLQHLFELPKCLRECVERKDFARAVRLHNRAKDTLAQYKDTAAFAGIYADCETLVDELKEALRNTFASSLGSSEQTAAAADLLLQLGEPADSLAEAFLAKAATHLQHQLAELQQQVVLKRAAVAGTKVLTNADAVRRPSDAILNLPMDVLEFVDSGLSNMFSDLSLFVTTYYEMFTGNKDRVSVSGANAERRVVQFANQQLADALAVAEQRFECEQEPTDMGVLVRALDRFYRRLAATSRVMPGAVSYAASSIAILQRVALSCVDSCHGHLNAQLKAHVKQARQSLAHVHNKRLMLGTGVEGGAKGDEIRATHVRYLEDLLSKLLQAVQLDTKTALAGLLQFVTPDVTFASETRFRVVLARATRERLVVQLLRDAVQLADEFCSGAGDKAYVHSALILLLSRFCQELQVSVAGYLLNLCEKQFSLDANTESAAAGGLTNLQSGPRPPKDVEQYTPADRVTKQLGAAAQRLLDRYVEMEGSGLSQHMSHIITSDTSSQLLVKSVDTRDWLACPEPKAVRAVMKRLVEDLADIDNRVGQLYVEGARRAGGGASDSSRGRRTLTAGARGTSTKGTGWRPLDGGGAMNALDKLWAERIDYFAPVQFNKASIVMGIVKICLKTLLESVRLKTFSTYGLQQVQVDCQYLQLYLWNFVYDEQLMFVMLDEVLKTTMQRCIQPVLMNQSIVDSICERA